MKFREVPLTVTALISEWHSITASTPQSQFSAGGRGALCLRPARHCRQSAQNPRKPRITAQRSLDNLSGEGGWSLCTKGIQNNMKNVQNHTMKKLDKL